MRASTLALATMAAVACGRGEPPRTSADTARTRPPAAPPLTQAPPRDTCATLTPPPAEDWDQREARVIAGLSGRARRMENGLALRLDNGGDLVLQDVEGDEDLTRYRLAGWNEALRAYEVAVAYYEGGSNLLIDARNGHRTRVWGMPVVSPDRRRFVAHSMDLEAAYDPNGIQVWRAGGDTLELEWQSELRWGPSHPLWLNDSTLAVRAHPGPGDRDATVRCIILSRHGTEWDSREAGS